MTEEQVEAEEFVAVAEPEQEDQTSQQPEESGQDRNWKAVRDQLAQLKDENQELRQAVQHVSYNQKPQEQADTSNDEDLLTKGEVKKLLAEKEAQIGMTLAELKMKSQYNDFNEVVSNEVFEDLKREFPGLGEAIMSSKDPNLLAYAIGKNSDTYRKKSGSSKQSEDAKQIIANSQKPGAVATASSGGGALSKADYFMNMSNTDFEQYVAKVKRDKDWTT